MLQNFIDYLLEQVENLSIYVWGGQGELGSDISDEWIRNKEKTSSSPESNAKRAIALYHKRINEGYKDKLRAFDCSGLGMYFIQNLHGLSKVDMSANTMKSKCETIKKSDLKKGDWVFRVNKNKYATHIGYVVDDDLNVVESQGRDVGVIKRSLNAGGNSYWNAFGRPIYFKSEIESGDSGETIVPDNGWRFEDEYWYYYIANERQTGWHLIEYKDKLEWFYLDPETYRMRIRWIQLNDFWYYMSGLTGVMQKGITSVDGVQYYFAENASDEYPEGAMQLGWVSDGEFSYYAMTDGKYGEFGQIALNSIIKSDDNDIYYLVDENGRWDEKTYFLVE